MKRHTLALVAVALSVLGVVAFAAYTPHARDGVPVVQVLAPNGGESFTSGTPVTIDWNAYVEGGTVDLVSVFVSFDGGANWDAVAVNMQNTGHVVWFVHNRPTQTALVRVQAFSSYGFDNSDDSDAPFTVVSGATGRVPTTLRDFDLPGTRPLDVMQVNPPDNCLSCHSFLDPNTEPYFNWKGSMMAYASVDPVFRAAFDVARQDAPESTDLCLRCHLNSAWLAGRANPTDGSQVQDRDRIGISCDLCHRMADPFFKPGISPDIDQDIIAALRTAPSALGDAQWVIDPANYRRRGPFDDAFAAPHEWLPSPFHRQSAMCGVCHDLSNPVFTRQPDGRYLPNNFDEAAPGFGVDELMPEQRTFSEWFFSAYNSPEGVYRPEFGGEQPYVSSCQSCHMPKASALDCWFPDVPVRQVGVHHLSGGGAWQLSLIPQVDPNADVAAVGEGVGRARYMLRHAAEMDLTHTDSQLSVRITNNTGHKLPTGYPEGRRMWIRVQFYDNQNQLIGGSGLYDFDTATLVPDTQAKIYEARLGVSEDIAGVVGLPAGTEFHLVLNSKIFKDNRIPPLGFTNSDYAWFGMPPIGAAYADGQNWDVTLYDIPVGATRADVTLYYQAVIREYVEFLRDAGEPGGAGQTLYDLWQANNQAAPEPMLYAEIGVPTRIRGDLNCDGVVDFADIDPFVAALSGQAAYAAQFPDCGWLQGDIDLNGTVDFADIDPFVACLSGGCP